MPPETPTEVTPPPEIPAVVEAVPTEPAAVEISAEPSAAPVQAVPPVEVTANLAPEVTPTSEPRSGHLGGNDPIATSETPAVEVLATPVQANESVFHAIEQASPSVSITSSPSVSASTKIRDLFVKALNARQNKKQKKIDHIMILLDKQTSVTNDDVEKFLHVSDSTATRYLATLEKEGKIKQGDKKGSAVSYSGV